MHLAKRLYLLIILSTLIGSSSYSCVNVQKLDDYFYNADWSNCPLPDMLADLNSKLRIECISRTDNLTFDNSVQPSVTKGTTVSIIRQVAQCYDLSERYVDLPHILVPQYTKDQISANRARDAAFRMETAEMIALMTPEQLAINKSQGGVPYSSLTDDEKSVLKYLVENWQVTGGFRMPFLVDSMPKCRVVLKVRPQINLYFTAKDSSRPGGGLYLGEGVSTKLQEGIFSEPGSDAPGNATKCTLKGEYTLATLAKMIDDDPKNPISVTAPNNRISITAYGTFTHAYVARAIGMTTGLDWIKNGHNWDLGLTAAHKSEGDYYNDDTLKNYRDTYESLIPRIKEVIASGQLISVGAKPFKEMTPAMLTYNEFNLESLTPDQKTALLEKRKLWSADTNWDTVVMKWNPGINIYAEVNGYKIYDDTINFP